MNVLSTKAPSSGSPRVEGEIRRGTHRVQQSTDVPDCSLTRLGLAPPSGITSNELVEVFETVGPSLTHLVLVLDCRDSITRIRHASDAATFLSQSPFPGASNQVVQRCPNLLALDIQEIGFDVAALETCTKLQALRMTVVDPTALLSRLIARRHPALQSLWLYSPSLFYSGKLPSQKLADKAKLKAAFEAQGLARVAIEHYWGYYGGWAVRHAFEKALALSPM